MFVLVSSSAAWAQASFQGSLRGAVKDADGVVPGVTITVVNEATNLSRDTVSNEVGEYAFPALTPGAYTVRAVLEGFKTFERKGLTVGTQQFITLDLRMEVGALAEHARSVFETAGLQRVERPSLRDIFVAMLRAARQAAKESALQ